MMTAKDLNRFLYAVGTGLYRIREDAGMSRAALQQKTKIHKNTILRYENGAASPTLRIIAVLADALGYEVRVSFVKKEGGETE